MPCSDAERGEGGRERGREEGGRAGGREKRSTSFHVLYNSANVFFRHFSFPISVEYSIQW